MSNPLDNSVDKPLDDAALVLFSGGQDSAT
jgi:hypothetical protein